MNETVSPVCSLEYREKMGGIDAPSDLVKCQLIHEIGMITNLGAMVRDDGAAVPRYAWARIQPWKHVH
ncbi:hypothetical protein [Rhizobium etli]|uniref:hypothetical protein n=1 Tax=Rhizobium etli TaxID=29449 RepID=UPI001FCBC27B|nr:hypothetical protein [Rhizobium etli]